MPKNKYRNNAQKYLNWISVWVCAVIHAYVSHMQLPGIAFSNTFFAVQRRNSGVPLCWRPTTAAASKKWRDVRDPLYAFGSISNYLYTSLTTTGISNRCILNFMCFVIWWNYEQWCIMPALMRQVVQQQAAVTVYLSKYLYVTYLCERVWVKHTDAHITHTTSHVYN